MTITVPVKYGKIVSAVIEHVRISLPDDSFARIIQNAIGTIDVSTDENRDEMMLKKYRIKIQIKTNLDPHRILKILIFATFAKPPNLDRLKSLLQVMFQEIQKITSITMYVEPIKYEYVGQMRIHSMPVL